MITIVGAQVLRPEIDMKSEMRSCLLLGITEAREAKASQPNAIYVYVITTIAYTHHWGFDIIQ